MLYLDTSFLVPLFLPEATSDKIERFLTRTSTLTISSEHHGPAGARNYRHDPTYIIRGLSDLHLEFTPA